MFWERRIGKSWPSSTGTAPHGLSWCRCARGGGWPDTAMSAPQLGQGPAAQLKHSSWVSSHWAPLHLSQTALGSPWSEPRRDICPISAGLECGPSHPGVGTALPRLTPCPGSSVQPIQSWTKNYKKISSLIWGKDFSRSLIRLHSTRCFSSVE